MDRTLLQRGVITLSQRDAFGRVLRRQHLAPERATPALERVVADLVGLHATLPTTPPLSLAARLPAFQREGLEHALYEARTLVRLKGIRQTVFIVPRASVPILLAATRPLLEVNQRRYLAAQGVSVEACEQLALRIVEALQGRELTVAELRAALGGAREVSATVGLLCDRGVLVRTRPARGWRDATNRYALLQEWLPDVDPDAIPEQDARVWLVQAYVGAYGPVSERDVAWWTGLPMTSVRAALAALASELVRVHVEGWESSLLMLGADVSVTQGAAVAARTNPVLLPVLDPYVMGYKERSRSVDPRIADRVYDRGGNGTATILLDGRVVGVWDAIERPEPAVRVHFFAPADDDLLTRVRVEAQRAGRVLLEREVAVQRVACMSPLTSRPTGAYAPFEGAAGGALL